jgi:hypothetical protein
VNKEQAFEELEFSKAKIGALGGVSALLSINSQTNVSLLDHADVVGTVTYCCRDRLVLTFLDQAYDLSLLSGRHTTAEHRIALHRYNAKEVFHVVLEDVAERLAVHYECQLFGRLLQGSTSNKNKY